jgi:RNA polymerase sigma factor (sigma-70 family)
MDHLALVELATAGDRAALDQLIDSIKDDLYGLALRMLANRADAEDAAQEVLIKIVTHLSEFRGESTFRTWAWRIASNHLLTMKRLAREEVSFEQLASQKEQMLDMSRSEPLADAERATLAEEVKVTCTSGMLVCLDREHRLAYVMGEVLGLSGDECAAILSLTPAALRKRLQRARQLMRSFMEEHCGIVNRSVRCRCEKLIDPAREVANVALFTFANYINLVIGTEIDFPLVMPMKQL